MDHALLLKSQVDQGVPLSKDRALELLHDSALVNRLTDSFIDKPLFSVWRLIALSEIPFAQHLPYTQELIDRVYRQMAGPFGFSLSGHASQFLPCYNAMIASALCRLGEANNRAVGNAISWIIDHQPMRRGETVSIPGFRFDRYGGCFENTPCYIGLVKSVVALLNYRITTGDAGVRTKLDEGIEYVLDHRLVYRRSDDRPITSHILDISFPESYQLNIVELIRFAGMANLLEDPRTEPVKQYLAGKMNAKNAWHVNYRYKADGYVVFDQGRRSGDWVTQIIRHALNSEHGVTAG